MKRGALIYLLIVFLLLNLTGCGANSVSAPSQKETDQEGESHYEENSQQEAGNSRKTSGTFTQPARLTLEEKELTVEEGQLFYGAFMVGLPEGVTARGQESVLAGQTVDLSGLEKYEEHAGKLEPRIRLVCYQAEYDSREALMVALLELTSGIMGKILYADEETEEYTFWIAEDSYQYYIFIREKEVYLVEALRWGEGYAFPWLLEEMQTVGWGDTEEAVNTGEESSLYYMLFSVQEGLDFLVLYDVIGEGIDETGFYNIGYYETPCQTVKNTGFPDKWGKRDWNFDGYGDIACGEVVLLWNPAKKEFTKAQFKLEGEKLRDAQLYPETKTIWTSEREYKEGRNFDVTEIETLWQWEEDTLVSVRECRLEETEEGIHIWAYGKTAEEELFDELISSEDKNRRTKIQKLYEAFYDGLVADKFYALEHNRAGEREYIPEELVEILKQAIEETKEYEVLPSLINDRELSEEEIIAIARENVDLRQELDDARIVGNYLMVEADIDNDGIMDILSETYFGGTAGFVDFVLFRGKEDGSYEETERFTEFRQEFSIISFQGKNYLLRTEFDYAKKLYSGLSLAYYEDGGLVEIVYLNLESDSYDMQVVECADPQYEKIADEMIQDGPLYKEKIEEYRTILGNAEEKMQKGEWGYSCDLDNDGKKELYNKYIWTASNMSTRDALEFEGKEDEGIRLIQEAVLNEETGWPIMLWVDTYETKNIIHVSYITGLYDFEQAGYLIEEDNCVQVYRIRGNANWYVDCVRNEKFR